MPQAFGELEREIIRGRVTAGLNRVQVEGIQELIDQ